MGWRGLWMGGGGGMGWWGLCELDGGLGFFVSGLEAEKRGV